MISLIWYRRSPTILSLVLRWINRILSTWKNDSKLHLKLLYVYRYIRGEHIYEIFVYRTGDYYRGYSGCGFRLKKRNGWTSWPSTDGTGLRKSTLRHWSMLRMPDRWFVCQVLYVLRLASHDFWRNVEATIFLYALRRTYSTLRRQWLLPF